ncbi:hypothetical protein AB3S75_027794 [Citrus x aurantiifolia]
MTQLIQYTVVCLFRRIIELTNSFSVCRHQAAANSHTKSFNFLWVKTEEGVEERSLLVTLAKSFFTTRSY